MKFTLAIKISNKLHESLESAFKFHGCPILKNFPITKNTTAKLSLHVSSCLIRT